MAYTENWNETTKRNLAFIDRNSLLNVVEIGAFEGLTSNFIVNELLAHNGNLVCIDPHDSEYALDGDGSLFEGQYERFIENIENNKERITYIRKKSCDALPLLQSNHFDLVFVDGDHTTPSVYTDGLEAFRICKVGGYILFDDLEWGNCKEVKQGIDRVLAENPNYKLLLYYNQVLIQKLEEGSEPEDGRERYQELSVEKLFNSETILAQYCNLSHRPERNEKMIEEIKKCNLKIERRESFAWKELYEGFDEEQKAKVDVMYKRSPGAIGCHFSQVAIMKEALEKNMHCIVLEDDLVICDDFNERLKIIFTYLNQHDWDLFFFGGHHHLDCVWHKSVEGRHVHSEMQVCNCNLNRDWEETTHPNITRTYGCFSTHAFLINKDRLQHILNLLDSNLHQSIGIDWIFLKEQPNLNVFCFKPGCIKQYSSQSDIGKGISNQESFRNLGQHWFSKKMNEYIPD